MDHIVIRNKDIADMYKNGFLVNYLIMDYACKNNRARNLRDNKKFYSLENNLYKKQ